MNCDWLAPYYESLEHISFGDYLEERRFAFLEEAKKSQRTLECGGGDGRFLARLLALNHGVQVDFVDSSSKMTELAERRVARMGSGFRERVRFFIGDVREFEPPQAGYDLIVTHFFLDCFNDEELTEVVARLASWRKADGRWVVSEFCEGHGLLRHLWSRAIIRSLYLAFLLTTGLQVTRLPNYKAALTEQGFSPRFEQSAFGGLLHSSLWGNFP
jgi:ubiquinone/menaquinone biosynthesis C-methylase UbiE